MPLSTPSYNFCTVLAWMCPQASLVSVPFHTTLISVLVFFCSKPPQPSNSLTFLSCLFPIRQNGFSLIVHGSFPHPVCYIDSPTFSLSSPVLLTFRLLPQCCTLIYTGAFLLTLGGVSLLSIAVLILFLFHCLLLLSMPSLHCHLHPSCHF